VIAVFCRRRGADSERLCCLAFGVRSVRRSPFSSSSGDRIISCPSPWFSARPLMEAGQTITSKLGGSETNIAYGDPVHWAAIVGLALVLLFMTCAVTIVATSWRRNAHA
jgi:hypothetical protein